MIVIDFSQAMALFISFILILVFGAWISYTCVDKNTLYQTNELEYCPYCTFIFFTHRKEELQACPRCKSYINITPHNERTKVKKHK